MKKYGIWSLIIGLLMFGIVSAQDDIDIIQINSSYIGEFTNEQTSVTIGFDGEVGDVIYVTALDIQVPVEFVLYSPSGGQLAQSDGTLIRNIELGTAGRYTVEFVRPDWSEDEGEFTAFVGYYELASMGIEDEGETLSYVNDLADAGALRQVRVDMNEDDMVSIETYADNIFLTIETENGDEPLFTDGGYSDIHVPIFQFPTTGTYIITIQTMEPDGTGMELYLYRIQPTTVTANSPIVDELEESVPTVFAFESPAGKMWDINATLPLNGEAFLAIYQFGDRPAWETLIEQDYGSGPDGQPRIRPFIPTEDDTYYIALWYDDWDTDYETYDYELVVSPSTLLSIPNNSPLTGTITNETGNAQYAYSGKAGSHIVITITRTSETGVLSMVMYSNEDEVISFAGRNASSGRFDVVLPLDGIYQFMIYNADYDEFSTLDYEILIETVDS